ncbi:MAG TPA: hypothetical protein DDZ81_13050 [Acetobacteraceae bacterium]|jgi:hypothetical protein|nr:hypothetical protein [Acetobacteraceae bacterium]
MTESEQISARLTVLETVVKQLITHMAIRDDDPPRWVRTRRTLAMSVIDSEAPRRAASLYVATEAFFDRADEVVRDYSGPAKSGTARVLAR